jgi:hypothetical protein
MYRTALFRTETDTIASSSVSLPSLHCMGPGMHACLLEGRGCVCLLAAACMCVKCWRFVAYEDRHPWSGLCLSLRASCRRAGRWYARLTNLSRTWTTIDERLTLPCPSLCLYELTSSCFHRQLLDLSPLALVQRAHTALLLVDRLARCVGEVFSTFSASLQVSTICIYGSS